MKVLQYDFKESEIDVLGIGDIHIGDKGFNAESKRKLKEYINWVKKHKNAYVFLMGDILNCATITSKSSVFQQDLGLDKQIDYAVKIFEPIKDRILGAITGNHESRMERHSDYNPLITVCSRLGIRYCGYSAVVKFRVGLVRKKRNPTNLEYQQSYIGYFHHTDGGGATIGGKMNRVDKLRQVVSNADFYCGAHNHMLGVAFASIFYYEHKDNTIKSKKQLLVDTGGYLAYRESYAEQKMLPPMKIGSAKINLSGRQYNHDVHCSV